MAAHRSPPRAADAHRAPQANSVGTVIKANGDVDPLGVVSVLPLDRHRQSPAVQQARRGRELLRSRAAVG